MRRHFVSGFPRALLSLGQEKSSGVEIVVLSTGAFCLRVRDFEISYERIRWPAISRNQNNGGLPGEKFRVRVVICVVYLPCLTWRRCQKIEKLNGWAVYGKKSQQSTFE